MTGAIGLPEEPEDPPIETEGVGDDPGSLPEAGPPTDSTTGNEPAAEPTGDDAELAAGRS